MATIPKPQEGREAEEAPVTAPKNTALTEAESNCVGWSRDQLTQPGLRLNETGRNEANLLAIISRLDAALVAAHKELAEGARLTMLEHVHFREDDDIPECALCRWGLKHAAKEADRGEI